MQWLLLFIAISGNVIANISFKKLMTLKQPEAEESSLLLSLLSNPWSWIALISCMALLFSYLLAIRSIGIATAYAVVTSVSLIILSMGSILIFGEKFPMLKMIGIAIIVLGVIFIAHSEIG